MNLSYAVIGCGGIGGYYGGSLAKAGHNVHFLLHSDYEFVKKNGLQIESVNESFHLTDVNAYNDTTQMPKCDVVFVCLKTTNNYILPQLLPPILHRNSVVVLIQNGLEIERNLQEELPNVTIVGATAFVCTFKIGLGHIRHAEYGTMTMAPYTDVDCLEVLEQVVVDFASAHVEVRLSRDLTSVRWKKLVWNIPYNGLTVVMNASTDVLTLNPSSRRLVIDLMNEVVEAARMCGAEISDSFVERMIELTEKMVPYSPSMRLDYEAHRPMEIQTMYTNPILVARLHGFEMKKTQMLEQQLRFISENQLTVKG